MRIALVAPLAAPLLTADVHGDHSLVADVARGLAERGHDVLLVCADGSNLPDVRLATVRVGGRRSRLVPGMAPRVLEAPMRDAYERAFAVARAHEPDAVSQHGFHADAIALAGDLPTIHTLHRGPIATPVVEALRATDAPRFALSETSGDEWVRADAGPIGLMPVGVPDLVRWPRGAAPRRPLEPDAVLVAGLVSPASGTAAAIRAARAAGLRPLVFGAVADEAYHRTEVAPLLRSDDAIRPVTRAALAATMGRVLATILAMDTDPAFPLMAAEAQVAGCPVVAYRRGALPEVVEDGVTGMLVDPGDEPALTEALRSARRIDRTRVRSIALERFALDPMIDAYEVELGRAAEAARSGSAKPVPIRRAG